MKSGGQTAEIKVGRQILCKEKPSTRATSVCAKQLTKTIKAAKRGLTAKQQKLWQKYVYTSAVLSAERYCMKSAAQRSRCKPWDVACLKRLPTVRYKQCAVSVLTGKTKFRDLFGKKFKWSDFLINGAKMIKKPPKYDFGSGVPGRKPTRRYRGNVPGGGGTSRKTTPRCTGGRIRINGRCKYPDGMTGAPK